VIEGILCALARLLLPRRVVVRMTHRTTALYGPLLESDERLADAASHDAEAKRRSEVRRVMLRVAYKLERDGPRPRNSDEREATRIEYSLRYSILVLDESVGNRIVCASGAQGSPMST